MFTDDISHNKIATQSHTNDDNDASRAVDGNTGTCMQSKPIGRSSPDTTVWWKVDLGEDYNIYSINIQFRNYDGYGLCFYNIYILFLRFVFFNKEFKTKTVCDVRKGTNRGP